MGYPVEKTAEPAPTERCTTSSSRTRLSGLWRLTRTSRYTLFLNVFARAPVCVHVRAFGGESSLVKVVASSLFFSFSFFFFKKEKLSLCHLVKLLGKLVFVTCVSVYYKQINNLNK